MGDADTQPIEYIMEAPSPEVSLTKEFLTIGGHKYFKVCDAAVRAGEEEDVYSFCVKREGHPGVLHEDYYGNVRSSLFTAEQLAKTTPISPNDKRLIEDIVSPDAPTTTNERGGSQSHIPVRFDLIDGKALFEMAAVLHTGAEKYGANNWRKIDVEDHLNHLIMHAYAYLAGDDTDDHLSHILCRATFALGVTLQDD